MDSLDIAPVGPLDGVTSSPARPAVAAVVVNWNTRQLLHDGLANLDAHLRVRSPGGHDAGSGDAAGGVEAAGEKRDEADCDEVWDEVCVVDNGSADGSLDDIDALWPSVQLIRNSDNRGFCRASNQGIRATDAPYVLLINTDARLADECLRAMATHLDRDSSVAIVGPRLVYGDGSFQRWTAGRPLTLWTCTVYYLLLERLGGSRRRLFQSMYIRSDTQQPVEVGWVSSAVMLIRRSALDAIGLLDEGIFLYMDDVDICDRARRHGYRVMYAADATAVHFMGSSSARAIDGQASPEAIRSLLRWFGRRHGRSQELALRMVVGAGFGLRSALFAARSLLESAGGPSRRSSAAHLANLKTVLKGAT